MREKETGKGQDGEGEKDREVDHRNLPQVLQEEQAIDL
jgi:hypothetical protein